MRIQHLGQRRGFALATSNTETAAIKARDIYLTIVAKGWKVAQGMFFKGRQSTMISAYVCADCGYVEFYADDPKALKIQEEKGK